jgi:hypothetical protein
VKKQDSLLIAGNGSGGRKKYHKEIKRYHARAKTIDFARKKLASREKP